VMICVFSAIAVNIPFYLKFYNTRYFKVGLLTKLPEKAINSLSYYVTQTGKHIFPWWLLVISLVLFLINIKKIRAFLTRENKTWSLFVFTLIFFCLNLLVMSMITSEYFFRYLIPAIPLLCITASITVDRVSKISIIAGIAVIVILGFNYRIPNYLYEITHEYRGPIKGICRYLNEHAKEGDVVATTYGDMGIKFYTELKVVAGESLDNDPELLKNADWVIFRKHTVYHRDEMARRIILKYLDRNKYKGTRLDYPDTMFENREAPDWHIFSTATTEDNVIIFQKIP
jgi:hypothetical protein